MKTHSAKPSEITRKWYLIDASKLPLGRLSTEVANLLTGKRKPAYTPHIDGGDYVVVINAGKLVVTGAKREKKIYYRHSQYPGGLTETSLQEKLSNDPREVIIHSVRGMLPVNKLRAPRLKRLKVYSGKEHEHTAQKPETLDLGRNK